MDDEDKILLMGIGALGAVAYLAVKEIQEREALEEQGESKISAQNDDVYDAGYTLSEKEEVEVPIYKDILELLFGRK
ncbi:MAG: hypothetical protein AMQ22_01885 [Candidatus Methanofastidiosum methylothiophilum]|uniref:Uncharacterized protein n=1 Tax=Candidatus Methanofastidiosum methylothiophilum TaxID=1705564 RepID=A0A150ITH8_9EURY|nr:MAG: hypothetical protein AMQ22_01885 [Candidatus Methanofastidiosum methylthiophilus]